MYKIKADIARVVSVNPNEFTVDMIGSDGCEYNNVEILSLYSKPDSNGQGVYMMPELDSIGLILNFSGQRVVVGFFNPVADGMFYEELFKGDFCLKTKANNKIIGRNNGIIDILASEQSKISLYPATGQSNDSSGQDNLLRVLVENLDIITDGGFLKHTVNKRDEVTDLEIELKDKPLHEDNPNKLRVSVGDNGNLYNFQLVTTERNGEDETVRYNYNQLSDGTKKQECFDENGEKLYTIDVESNLTRRIKTAEGYEQILKPDGSFEESTENGYSLGRESDGTTEIIAGNITINVDPSGEINIEASDSITMKTGSEINLETNDVNVDASHVEVSANSANVDANSLTFTNEALVKESFINGLTSYINGHTHTGNNGAPTSLPLSQFQSVDDTTEI